MAHPHSDLAPPVLAVPRSRAGLRLALMVMAAACIYGSWAFFANLGHGGSAARWAALTQGASSGTTTLVIGTVIEVLYAALRPSRYRALLATGTSASLTALVHLGVNLAAGTPEIARTILPSVVIGYAFAAFYAYKLAAPGGAPRVRLGYHRTSTLTGAERDAIWALLERSVQRDRSAFEAKLARTEEVFLGRLPSDELVAFGAVDTLEDTIEGRTHALLYTHWAMLDPRVRGCNVIQRVGLRCFLRHRLRHPLRPVYWLFSASTYQSYLLLVRNFERFWPKLSVSWPSTERALVEAVMIASGDDGWDPEAGVLRRKGSSRYREGIVDDEPALLDHPTLGPRHPRLPRAQSRTGRGRLSRLPLPALRRQLLVVGAHGAPPQPAPRRPARRSLPRRHARRVEGRPRRGDVAITRRRALSPARESPYGYETMRAPPLHLVLVPAILVACGGNVVVDPASMTTGAGAATTTTSTIGVGAGTTTTSTTGAGGASTTTTTTTTVGAGGGPTCVGFMAVLLDGAGLPPFSSSCSMGGEPPPPLSTPLGEVLGSGSSASTFIDGCASEAPQAQGVFMAFEGEGAGTYQPPKAFYVDPSGATCGADSTATMLTIDTFGPVGGMITGFFTMAVFDNVMGEHKVEGKFSVCRVPDNITE